MGTWFKAIALVGMGALCASVFAVNSARPGTVNYIEGAAYLNGNQLRTSDIGSASLDVGQVLRTGQGRAEILLTPGVFLRLDDHTAVKMVTPNLTLTQVELEQGRVGVEVDEIFAQNNLRVIVGGVATQLVKPGYYEFVAGDAMVMVFKGKAAVRVGEGKYTVVKGHHQFALAAGAGAKPVKFDVHAAEDDFYSWNTLRSQYLIEANNQMSAYYADVEGFYPGWYWDPYMWDYAYLGFYPYWGPFDFGFFPWWGGGGYYGGGHYGHGHYGHGHYGYGGGYAGHGYGVGAGGHGGEGSGGFGGGHDGGFGGGHGGGFGGGGGGGGHGGR